MKIYLLVLSALSHIMCTVNSVSASQCKNSLLKENSPECQILRMPVYPKRNQPCLDIALRLSLSNSADLLNLIVW